MSLLWGTVVAVFVIIWIITVVDVVHRRVALAPAAAWLVFVAVLPVIGAAVYWGTRKTSPEDLQRTVDARRELRRNSPYDPT